MEPQQNPFQERLVAFLSYSEMAFLAVSLLGLSFYHLSIGGARQLILFGFTGLAVTYFLTGYTNPPRLADQVEESEQKGFFDLLIKVILRKVIFIGCSIVIVGHLMGVLDLNGAGQIMLVGAASLILSVVICLVAILRKPDFKAILKAPLLRAVPLGLLGVYWLYSHGLNA